MAGSNRCGFFEVRKSGSKAQAEPRREGESERTVDSSLVRKANSWVMLRVTRNSGSSVSIWGETMHASRLCSLI